MKRPMEGEEGGIVPLGFRSFDLHQQPQTVTADKVPQVSEESNVFAMIETEDMSPARPGPQRFKVRIPRSYRP